ncbi:MAG: hypothetical protein R3C61_13095 [Bacteroidia bacterium]
MKKLLTILSLCLMCVSIHAQSTIPIRETATYPDSVLYTASALLPNGNVIVWGGQKLAKAPGGKIWLSNKSYVYDPTAETWTSGPDLNAEVAAPLVVTLANGNIMSIGGNGYQTIAGIDSFPLRTDNVEILDVITNEWTVVAGVPFGTSPYTGTSGILLPDSNVWMTTTNGDYGTFDTKSLTWTNQTSVFGPLDAGGRPIVILDNGIIFHTGAGGQYYSLGGNSISYADPVVPMYTGDVVKLQDGRILTWDDGFSFSQEAIMVNTTGTSSMVTDSLVIPGQATTGRLMPDGKVWVFGFGEVGFGPYTLLQIFDPSTDTWSSPGTYNFHPEILTGYHMHLLGDTSLVVITTTQTASYRINAGEGATGIKSLVKMLNWQMIYEQQSEMLSVRSNVGVEKMKVNLTLMDIQGRVIHEESAIPVEWGISLANLSPGVYVARLLREDGAWMVKKIRVD